MNTLALTPYSEQRRPDAFSPDCAMLTRTSTPSASAPSPSRHATPLYTTCLFCHTDLGANHFLPTFPVGRRLAFDPKKGRLWVICTRCGRWNLTPLEERWEAIDEAERLFRGTRLRMSTDNVGLAHFRGGFELVRVGPALLPEIASWRYGTRLARFEPETSSRPALFIRGARLIARATAGALVGYAHAVGFSDDAVLRMRTFRRGQGVLLRTNDEYGHPDRRSLLASRRRGARASGEGRALAAQAAPRHRHRDARRVAGAARRGKDARDAERRRREPRPRCSTPSRSSTTRAIPKATSRASRRSRCARRGAAFPTRRRAGAPSRSGSFSERLALQLANRSFWGRGGTGQRRADAALSAAGGRPARARDGGERRHRAPRAARRARALHAAWKDAEEIAAIADEMFTDDVLDEFKRQYYERIAAGDASPEKSLSPDGLDATDNVRLRSMTELARHDQSD